MYFILYIYFIFFIVFHFIFLFIHSILVFIFLTRSFSKISIYFQTPIQPTETITALLPTKGPLTLLDANKVCILMVFNLIIIIFVIIIIIQTFFSKKNDKFFQFYSLS